MDLLSRLHGLACADRDGSRQECRGTCEHRAGEYLGEGWPRCPVADIEADDHLMATMRLRSQARHSALAGYPDVYTAGVMLTWQAIDSSEAERIESERKESPHG